MFLILGQFLKKALIETGLQNSVEILHQWRQCRSILKLRCKGSPVYHGNIKTLVQYGVEIAIHIRFLS